VPVHFCFSFSRHAIRDSTNITLLTFPWFPRQLTHHPIYKYPDGTQCIKSNIYSFQIGIKRHNNITWITASGRPIRAGMVDIRETRNAHKILGLLFFFFTLSIVHYSREHTVSETGPPRVGASHALPWEPVSETVWISDVRGRGKVILSVTVVKAFQNILKI
jgi:hypothetical protein